MAIVLMTPEAAAAPPELLVPVYVQQYNPLTFKWERQVALEYSTSATDVQFESDDWNLEICPLAWTADIRDTIDLFSAAGLPLTRVFAGVNNDDCGLQQCSSNGSGASGCSIPELTARNPPGFMGAQPNKWVVDEETTVHVILSYDSAAYDVLDPQDGAIAGVVGIVFEDHIWGTITLQSGWDIVINGIDYQLPDILDGLPSDYPVVDDPFEVFQSTIVMHELMHGLGADHISASSQSIIAASVMFPTTGGRGHSIEEHNADLWGTDPAGEIEIPYADLDFLHSYYPTLVSTPIGAHRWHTWRPIFDAGSWQTVPFGGVKEYSSAPQRDYLGNFCPSDSLDTAQILTLTENLPGLSGTVNESINVRFQAVSIGTPWVVLQTSIGSFSTTFGGELWSPSKFAPPTSWSVERIRAPQPNPNTGPTNVEILDVQLEDLSTGDILQLPFSMGAVEDCTCEDNNGVTCCEIECEG